MHKAWRKKLVMPKGKDQRLFVPQGLDLGITHPPAAQAASPEPQQRSSQRGSPARGQHLGEKGGHTYRLLFTQVVSPDPAPVQVNVQQDDQGQKVCIYLVQGIKLEILAQESSAAKLE
jgi:hypothetical protein